MFPAARKHVPSAFIATPRYAPLPLTAPQVGVSSEPDLISLTLGAHDRFLLLATDGVWEFITSQEAVDLVAAAGSVEEGCRVVSWVLWGRRRACTPVDAPFHAITHAHNARSLSTRRISAGWWRKTALWMTSPLWWWRSSMTARRLVWAPA